MMTEERVVSNREESSVNDESSGSYGGSYTQSEGSPMGWVKNLEAMFSLPMLFPYHIGGYSVAAGLSSGPSSGTNSLTCSAKANASLRGSHTKSSAETTTIYWSRVKIPVESLPIWEVLESLHEDFLNSHRPHRLTSRPSDSTLDPKKASFELKHLLNQITLIRRVGSFDEHGLLLSRLHEKAADLAAHVGDMTLMKELMTSLAALQTSTYARSKSRFDGEALAETHCALADAWRDECHWPNAMGHYEAALNILETVCGTINLKVAECLFKIGQTVLRIHDGNNRASQKFLDEAWAICKNICDTDDEKGPVDYLLGNILIAMGDANGQGGESDQAKAYYEEGLTLLLREGKDAEVILDALVAIGDLHCSRGNLGEALLNFQKVASKYSAFPDLYEYAVLKRSILQFNQGKTGAALKDVEGYIRSRRQNDSNHMADYAWFIGMLSAGACLQLQKKIKEANQYYKEANALVAQPDSPLLLQYPIVETTLWNVMDDWHHVEEGG